ncbi:MULTISPECIES: pilus assembly protein TadG-related protein [Nocardioides]|uniref:Pilus assembly protein TadG-related protein n=1 Tax=Nocardioides vastitatis TaxID=2568655 RepID=A0ABW0ZHI4_9ACTN|nr:pilus assembly protein TadG-related protein [Nocardioides sp.]THI99684.1 hypothetical protein E7Z54_12335 [Nocardioides sp.]
MVLVRRHDRDERGAAAVLVAVMGVLLLLMVGLVLDLGLARDTRGKSQNAADASALAAGNVLYDDAGSPDFGAAVAAAKAYAGQNFDVSPADWSACTDSGRLAHTPDASPCISFDSVSAPTKVRVRIPDRRVDTAFAGLAGIESFTIATAARVVLDRGGVLDCGLCVLGSGVEHDLQNGDATVHGGNIHFNGSVAVSNNGLVATDGNITVEGSASGGMANYSPDPRTGYPAIDDPLATLALPPDMTGLTGQTIAGNECPPGPGIYSGLNLRGKTCTLPPGLYVVAGGLWDLAGNTATQLNGTGVTIYLTCSSLAQPRQCAQGEQGATIDASGNATLAIKAPTSGPLAGLSIVYDRNNSQTLRLTGNGGAGFTGTIYGKSATLQMNGNGCASTFRAAIIVNDLTMAGNPSCLVARYVPSENWAPPPGELRLDH